MIACRGCGKTDLSRVVDLGKVPAADHFPLATDPVRAEEEASHPLAMDLCGVCGLAQLADDDTVGTARLVAALNERQSRTSS